MTLETLHQQSEAALKALEANPEGYAKMAAKDAVIRALVAEHEAVGKLIAEGEAK